MCIAAQGSSSHRRPEEGVPGVLTQYRRLEQCVRYAREQYRVYRHSGRVSGMHKSKITAQGQSGGRVTINTGSGRYARSTSQCHRPDSVSGMQVRSISVYHRPGQFARYRRQG